MMLRLSLNCDNVAVMMTVADLIEKLKAFPADAAVVTGGFDEYDVDDIMTVQAVTIQRGAGGNSHSGEHKLYGDEVAVWIDWREP